jgi:glycosyltransferase involved in cell wall biosynthesis
MRIAVLSLTRDRLDYTKHCFARLRELAGCDFQHFVFDNGSTDGTQDWLRKTYAPAWLDLCPENVGVSRGINALLDRAKNFDVIVKFDNDCELTVPDTLRVAAEIAATGDWIMSPHIHGLNDPPPVQREQTVLGHRVGIPPLIGGIFMAAPASLYDTYRHNDDNPLWGMDDVNLCSWWRSQGHDFGYLLDYPATHYETTRGQRERYPDYFERKMAEFNA